MLMIYIESEEGLLEAQTDEPPPEENLCRAWSNYFKGFCWSDYNCANACKRENYLTGLCVIKLKPFGIHCICEYNC